MRIPSPWEPRPTPRTTTSEAAAAPVAPSVLAGGEDPLAFWVWLSAFAGDEPQAASRATGATRPPQAETPKPDAPPADTPVSASRVEAPQGAAKPTSEPSALTEAHAASFWDEDGDSIDDWGAPEPVTFAGLMPPTPTALPLPWWPMGLLPATFSSRSNSLGAAGPSIPDGWADEVRKAYRSGQPLRLEVDETTSVVLRMADGQVSAQFVTSDLAASQYLRQHLADLAARLRARDLPVRELTHRFSDAPSEDEHSDDPTR